MSDAARAIIGIYCRHARAWTAARGKRLTEKGWIDLFTQILPAAGHVLDIGCGSGEPIAHYLADQGFTVTGVDSSPEMVDLFAQNLPEQAAILADMRSLKLRKRFDGLLAWDSFFHLTHDDQRAIFPLFREHAAPQAALMFTSGPMHGEAIGTLEGEPLYHASLAPSEYVHLLSANNFSVVAHVPEDVTCGGRTVWLAQRD
jgi:SAM-dependent methyltransferase